MKRLAKEEKVKKKAEIEEKAAQEKQRAAQMMSSFFGRAPASSPVKGESRRDRSASRSSREYRYRNQQCDVRPDVY